MKCRFYKEDLIFKHRYYGCCDKQCFQKDEESRNLRVVKMDNEFIKSWLDSFDRNFHIMKCKGEL